MKQIMSFIYKDRFLNSESIDWRKIPFQLMTHAIWSFHHPQEDGAIISPHQHLEKEILPDLIQLAHSLDCKVLIAIGGWGNSEAFSKIAATEKSRTKFALSCLHLLEKTNADGIDIDWEFPGLNEFNGVAEDKQNLILLLKEIRNHLSKKHILTIDIPCLANWFQFFDMREIEKIVDFSSIMTYDMASPELNSTNSVWHNSALYDDGGNHWSWHRINEYFKDLDKSKLNFGMAFYGRHYKQAEFFTQVWSTEQSNNHGPSALLYSEIIPLINQTWKEHWDPIAKVPFLKSTQGLISYDNERSIKLKSNYIIQEGLCGVIIWELACDQINGKHPLLEAACSVLNPSKNN